MPPKGSSKASGKKAAPKKPVKKTTTSKKSDTVKEKKTAPVRSKSVEKPKPAPAKKSAVPSKKASAKTIKKAASKESLSARIPPVKTTKKKEPSKLVPQASKKSTAKNTPRRALRRPSVELVTEDISINITQDSDPQTKNDVQTQEKVQEQKQEEIVMNIPEVNTLEYQQCMNIPFLSVVSSFPPPPANLQELLDALPA